MEDFDHLETAMIMYIDKFSTNIIVAREVYWTVLDLDIWTVIELIIILLFPLFK